MQRTTNILNTIERIYESLNDSQLNEDTLRSVEQDLGELAAYLNVNAQEAMMFALVFSFQITERTFDFNNLSSYLRISAFHAFEFLDCLQGLVGKKLCFDEVQSRGRNQRKNKTEYLVNQHVFHAIVENRPFPAKEIYFVPTSLEWLEQMYEFIDDDIQFMNSAELEREMNKRLNSEVNGGLPEFIRELNEGSHRNLLMIYAIWQALVQDTYFTLDNFFSNFRKSSLLAFREKKKMLNGSHPFIQKGYFDVQSGSFGNDVEVGISDALKKRLSQYGLEFLGENPKKNKKFSLGPEEIKAKTLYYNDAEQRQLTTLLEAFQPKNMEQLQCRMKERGLPSGVAALFFGSPGTGKTESALQLARLTGRAIVQVDISATKSMWFGQSEKIVKQIFTDYKALCEHAPITPILFLNEADALLSKRKSNQSNVGQTENAIQNILLEEIEKLEGILIATTNLELNLDSAFDRRFLFKVRFEKPDLLQRQKIWADKLPQYEDGLLTSLASQFDLSGGQIDNIVRKTEIDYILNGAFPTEFDLFKYCQDELSLHKSGNRIGFVRESVNC
jgi:hypothetical protein